MGGALTGVSDRSLVGVGGLDFGLGAGAESRTRVLMILQCVGASVSYGCGVCSRAGSVYMGILLTS